MSRADRRISEPSTVSFKDFYRCIDDMQVNKTTESGVEIRQSYFLKNICHP